MNNLTLLYIPVANKEHAQEIVAQLLHNRMIATAHLLPSMHLNWWEEEKADQGGAVIVAKTVPELAGLAAQAIKNMPYASGDISIVPTSTSYAYADFMHKIMYQ